MAQGGGGAGIIGLGAYLPRRVMTNRDWEEFLGIPGLAKRLEERTGIRERRIAAEDESTVDLAVAAARAALRDAGLAATELAEIIVATDTPEVFAPDTAAYVQHRLGAGPVPAYELKGGGCAGFLQGLELARSRVHEGHAPVLLIAVELISKVMDWHDPRIAPLFGDGAAAAVIAPAEQLQILVILNATDGRHADALGLEVGGTRRPVTPERVARGEHRRVVLQGEVVFRHAIRRMTEAGRLILERARLGPEGVALLITGQANLHIVKAVAEGLGVSPERAAINLDRYGDTGSAALPLALEEALCEGRVKRGDHILLTAFGAGFHWGAALIRV